MSLLILGVINFLNNLDNIYKENFGFGSRIAEVYRQLFISVFKLEKFDFLVQIITNCGNIWKFFKVIFPETIKADEEWSVEAKDIFNSVLKSKQYFINPIEGLVYNVK